MRNGIIRAHWLVSAALIGTVFGSAAHAQTDESLSAERATYEDIIIQARRRSESILQVPVVANVVGAEQLQQFAISDIRSISSQIPGLIIGEAIGAFGGQVSLRGVGTAVLNPTIDQSISLNVDGLQLTQGLGYAAAMFDMAQVSVLKGPQALFFGKASPGGVISVKTADPGSEAEFIARGNYDFEARTKQMELIASGPLSDTLGMRLAGQFSDSEGFFRNKAIATPNTGALDPRNKRLPQNQTWMLRGTIAWDPSDNFDAKLKVNYTESDTQGTAGEGQYASCPDGITSVTSINFLGGEDCKIDRTIRIVDMDPNAFVGGLKNGGTPFITTRQLFGTLDLNYKVSPDVTLSSVTGYYDVGMDTLFNGTVTTAAGTPIPTTNNFDRTDFTQEVRFTSDFTDSPLNFMVGAFYQHSKTRFTIDVPTNSALGLPFPPRLMLGWHNVEGESLAFFGQLLWKIAPRLELGVGARWTDETRTQVQTNNITGTPVVTNLAVPKITATNVSPEVSLTYTPTDNLTLFAALKQAYKSGSFDTGRIGATGSDLSFKDERVRGGEAGIKTRLIDNSLTMELAGYLYKFDNMQVGANEVGANGAISVRTLNAAAAKVYGIDFDTKFSPRSIEGLTLHGAINWNISRYGNFTDAPCWGGQRIQDGCDALLNPNTNRYTAQNLSGRPLMRAPIWAAMAGFTYETPINDRLNIAFASNGQYSSSYYTNILLRDDMRQKAFTKVNASVALKDAQGAWELSLLSNNLTNKLVTGNCVNANFQDGVVIPTLVTGDTFRGPGGVDELQCKVDRGREVWLRLSVNLGKLFR